MHVLFDLDGTLIDSRPGIFEALRRSLSRCGIAPSVAIDGRLIGPPLRSILQTVAGSETTSVIDRLEAVFCEEYDAWACLESRAYSGMGALLALLGSRGCVSHLVTNKRLFPTRRILGALGWEPYFASINTLDSFEGVLRKAQVVNRMMASGSVSFPAVLVGDSADDAQAAQENGLSFFWVSWGYGELVSPATVVAGAEDLAGQLLRGPPSMADGSVA